MMQFTGTESEGERGSGTKMELGPLNMGWRDAVITSKQIF